MAPSITRTMPCWLRLARCMGEKASGKLQTAIKLHLELFIEADVVDLLLTPTIATPSHKSKVRVQASVSPAFADVILWPHDSPEKRKKRTTKRLPSAITSATWIRSFEEKLKAQNEKDSKKKNRIKKREDQL